MGFDNIDFLRYITPSLATISYPIKQIGEEAVKALYQAMEGEQVSTPILLETEIVPGSSI